MFVELLFQKLILFLEGFDFLTQLSFIFIKISFPPFLLTNLLVDLYFAHKLIFSQLILVLSFMLILAAIFHMTVLIDDIGLTLMFFDFGGILAVKKVVV